MKFLNGTLPFLSFLYCQFIALAFADVETFTGGLAKRGDSGDFYEEGTGNKCKYNEIWTYHYSKGSIHFGAVSQDIWEHGKHCSRCIQVMPKGIQGKNITVMVTSYYSNTSICYDCGTYGLLLSPQAYRSLTNYHGGSRVRIDWFFIACPLAYKHGTIEYYFNYGNSKYFLSIQPRNMKQELDHIEFIDLQRKSVHMMNYNEEQYGPYYYIDLGALNQPIEGNYTIRLVSVTNKIVEDTFHEIPMDTTMSSHGQFE